MRASIPQPPANSEIYTALGSLSTFVSSVYQRMVCRVSGVSKIITDDIDPVKEFIIALGTGGGLST